MRCSFQPNQYAITYSRSPLVYQYDRLNSGCTYTIGIYMSIIDTEDIPLIVTINRTQTSDNKITIDISNIVSNFIKSSLSFSGENITYVYVTCTEYLNGVVTSSAGSTVIQCSNGYTHYAQQGTGAINITDKYTFTSYVMNSHVTGSTNLYTIPTTSHYQLSIRNAFVWTNVRLSYYGWDTEAIPATYGLRTTDETIPSFYVQANSNVYTLPCGYIDLNAYGYLVDTTKNYTVGFYLGTTLKELYTFAPQDTGCNNITTLQFLNKWGVWDFLHFYGRKDDGLSVESDTYKYNNIDMSDLTYNISDGQYHKLFVKGKRKITLNTGWFDENKNNKLQELFLSEYVIDYDTKLPYNLIDKEVKYKTDRYDRLFNYSLIFEYAYDEINTMI